MLTVSDWAQRLNALLLERCAKWLNFYSSHKTDACGGLVFGFVFFPFQSPMLIRIQQEEEEHATTLGIQWDMFSQGLGWPCWAVLAPRAGQTGIHTVVGFHHSTPLHLVPMVCKKEVRLYCDIVILHPLSHSMFTVTTTPPPPPPPKPSPFQAEARRG